MVNGFFEYKGDEIIFKNVVVTPNDPNTPSHEISGTIKQEYKNVNNQEFIIRTFSSLKYSTEKEDQKISYTIDGEYTNNNSIGEYSFNGSINGIKLNIKNSLGSNDVRSHFKYFVFWLFFNFRSYKK